MRKMAGWLHGVCVGACAFGPPQCGFSLLLFTPNYNQRHGIAKVATATATVYT